jgi:hypothetical protein
VKARAATAVIAALVSVGGCEARDTALRLTLDPPTLREEVHRVALSAHRGGCEGPSVWSSGTLAPDRLPSSVPLAPGAYCLRARVMDATCAWIAEGTTTTQLPLEAGAAVEVVLRGGGREPCSGAACGDCGAADGGPDRPDGGASDAGPPETCTDEGAVACEDDRRSVCLGGRRLEGRCDGCVADGRCAAFATSNLGGPETWGGGDLALDTADHLDPDDSRWLVVDAVTGELCRRTPGEAAACSGAPLAELPHRLLPRQIARDGSDASGPRIGVVSLASLHVRPGHVLLVVQSGSTPTPLAFQVDGPVRVEGELLASASPHGDTAFRLNGEWVAASGPGGNPGSPADDAEGGAAGRAQGETDRSGAGGGGFGGPGGRGGAGGTVAGGAGGVAHGAPDLVPLRGGTGGGGGAPDQDGGGGGWGGGAVQIASRAWIFVTESGVIDASGEGGYGGRLDGSAEPGLERGSGGGGGSGGGILLEAPAIRIDGWVTANGGGGGMGFCELVSPDEHQGQSGGWDRSPARAQGAEAVTGCAAGSGGDGSGLRGVAGNGRPQSRGGGGGGGGGRIFFRAADSALVVRDERIMPALDVVPVGADAPAASTGPLY